MHCHKAFTDSAHGWPVNTRKHFLWGLALIMIGSAFLLDRFGWLDLHQYLGDNVHWWHFWPAALILVGVIEILSARRPAHVARGGFNITIGVWLLACLEHWWGWTFTNSWPVWVIALGVNIMVGDTGCSKKNRNPQDTP